MNKNIQFILNGRQVNLTTDPDRMLLWVLRTDFGLTGPKYGCGQEQCGACTVLLNNRPILSCQTPIREVQGKKIITIEGLAMGSKLHPLQEAFIKQDALQCGFCTPGMILKAFGLLNENLNPSKDEIISWMDDNLCRCGSTPGIIRAVLEAAQLMRGGS